MSARSFEITCLDPDCDETITIDVDLYRDECLIPSPGSRHGYGAKPETGIDILAVGAPCGHKYNDHDLATEIEKLIKDNRED
jgi:hypothetical protein